MNNQNVTSVLVVYQCNVFVGGRPLRRDAKPATSRAVASNLVVLDFVVRSWSTFTASQRDVSQ
jgi:hypothetical protein